MLRIIKRDGTIQDYDAVKLQKWAIWSAQDIRERANWSKVVTKTVKNLSGVISSQDLQRALIAQCVRAKRWPEALMAGRLYAALTRKEIYDDRIPTVRKLHAKLADLGLMARLPYTDVDYAEIEKIIDHERDFHLSYAQIRQDRKKYAIQNLVKGIEYETPQFIFMRMAMKLAQNASPELRLQLVQELYDDLSLSRINAPSPNYLNLGTLLNGLASCCLIASGDNDESLAITDYIARKMTVKSAGIGTILMTRSIGDPVRGGRIRHLGKMGYYRSLTGTVKSSIQAGRGGALTTYFSIYDPEAVTMIMAQNPRTPEDQRNRDLHFAWQDNAHFAKKVMLNEDIFTFNCYTAPDLYKALFSGDQSEFEKLYQKYEQDETFEKNYVNARDLLVKAMTQRNEVGTLYHMNVGEVNRHTSFEEPILSSNLCAEITQVTYPYYDMRHLFSSETHGFVKFTDQNGEQMTVNYNDRVTVLNKDLTTTTTFAGNIKPGQQVFFAHLAELLPEYTKAGTVIESVEEVRQESEISTCSLGGIVITNIRSDEEYYRAAYNSLLMIDECIDLTEYAFPHLEVTAKARRNAAVGILGLAHHMARKGLKYDTPDGLEEIHRVAERHTYFLIKAAIQLARERGVAPWIHKTKWVNGWLPIDTYKRTVDELVAPNYVYDWEALREEIRQVGGLRFSSLVAHMPTESSSKASGAPNGVYPVRDLSLKKTDVSNALDWVAPDNDILEDAYQLAWDITPVDQVKFYAVIQKFADQTISADIYRNRTKKVTNEEGKEVTAPLTDEELILEYQAKFKYGQKTDYYNNSFTGGKSISTIELKPSETASGSQDQNTATTNIAPVAVVESNSLNEESLRLNSDPNVTTAVSAVETQKKVDALDELHGVEEAGACAGGFCTL
jgi:ribonucleoside-diphosphate reductase alpha chain